MADAADFADWALHEHGGAVPADNLFFWTHPAPEKPSRALAEYLKEPTEWVDPEQGPVRPDPSVALKADVLVETALRAGQALRVAALHGAAEPSRIFVFLAGHGVQTNTTGARFENQTCFVCGDFRPDAMTVLGLVPCEDLRRALLAGGFDQVFMFLDCCRVAMTRLNMPAPALLSAETRLPAETVWGVAAAAQKNRIAYETTIPPTRGAFSKTLLEGLRTVRHPDTGELTVESLRVFVRDNIRAHTDKDQRPSFSAEPTDPWPVIASGPPILPQPDAGAVRIHAGAVPPGTPIQLSDAVGRPVGEAFAASGEVVAVEVSAGFYSVDIVGTDRSVAFRHAGPEGTDVVL